MASQDGYINSPTGMPSWKSESLLRRSLGSLSEDDEPTTDSASLCLIPEEKHWPDDTDSMDGVFPNSTEPQPGPPPQQNGSGSHTTHTEDDMESQSGSSTRDGMLSAENIDLKERVISLETKLTQQEDEIICLKSALADCLRRISFIEANKTANTGHVLPNKPNIRTTPRRGNTPISSTSTPSRRAISQTDISSSRVHPTSSTPSRPAPRPSHQTPSQRMQKHPSSPSTADHNGPLSPASVRDPNYNADEGILRFYLRGRAISFYSPSNLENYSTEGEAELPAEKLKLEWVYGYRGRDARSNIYLLPTGEVIYFIASVVVLYNVEEQMQRHYVGHTDDVKCIAVHPDKITIASGQVAGHDKKEGKPHIRIWNSVNLNTLKIIGIGDFERAVACCAFSKADGGIYLACVDEANEHCISLWDWNKGEHGQRITETKSSTEAVLACDFHPCEKNIIITCGKNQISFWNVESGTLTRKQGIFERNDKPKFVTCIAFAENGDVLSGDSNGNVFVWGKGSNRITQAMVGAHDGGIFSICAMKDGTILTGGKDRRIVAWNADYTAKGLEHEIPEPYGAVRMLSQGKGGMILVGTTKNCILQGTLELKFSPIVQGHNDELWGMCTHPNQHQFVSCGYDKNLVLWDNLTHSAVWFKELPDGGHCAAFHPGGEVIAVGTQSARWLIIDTTSRDIVYTQTDGNEQLECILYSPDGSMLAVGSRDNYIYIYAASEDGRKYNRIGRCSGHSSFVTHIDWSEDSQYLRSNSGDYELLHWNSSTCRQVTAASTMRDLAWATNLCTLTFDNCGIWPEGADGTDVNACCRSHTQGLMATADDFGKVNLYKYPTNVPKSPGHVYGGHSSHVTNVQFLYDDSRLLSTGGKDTAVLQWQII